MVAGVLVAVPGAADTADVAVGEGPAAARAERRLRDAVDGDRARVQRVVRPLLADDDDDPELPRISQRHGNGLTRTDDDVLVVREVVARHARLLVDPVLPRNHVRDRAVA